MAKTASSLDLNLVRLDRRKSIPLTTQLYDSLRDAIQAGQLPKRFRLPSTRELAVQLSISRTTVINAFDQLVAEGYLVSSVGQGTHVSHRLPEEDLMAKFHRSERKSEQKERASSPKEVAKLDSSFGLAVAEIDLSHLSVSNELKPFRAGVPALDEFPVALWSRLVRKIWRDMDFQDLSYGDAAGHLPLRKAIANYVRGFRGVRCSDDQVMIVNGTQQALDIATRLVMGPGDKVLFESPGYPRAKSAFQSLEVHLVHVPVDQNGMNVAKAVEFSPDAKLAYVTPSHQFPLGVTMTIERRMQLIDWANQHQSLIIEDDYDSEFCYSHRPIPSLQGLDSGDRTIYIGSFSKVIYPSLGIGYAIVPPGVVDRFRNVLGLVGRPPSKIDQMVLTEFIEAGHFARHLRRMRTVHKARRSALIDALQQQLGDVLKIIGTDAGLHLTALLDAKWNDRAVAHKAADLGVLIKPLSVFFDDDQQSDLRNGLVFGFASSTPSQIRGAIRKLQPIFRGRI